MGAPLVLFDLDGTLVDSGPGIASSVIHAARGVGLPEPAPAQLRALVGPPFPRAFVDVLGASDAEAMRMMELYREVYGRTGLYDVRVYDGIAAVLDGLAAAGATLALTTSKPVVFAREVLRHVGLAPAFDAGIHGATLDGSVEGKAAVVGLALAASPDARVAGLVGDRRHDVEGAHHHDLTAIGVTWGFGGRDELTAAGADHVVDAPGELAGTLAALL